MPNESKLRSNVVRNNVFLSLLFKGLSISLSFYLVPLTLKLLGKELYGVWIVMLSILTWILLFDIGIGNGLRNKLTENITQKRYLSARSNISTAYLMMVGIALSLMVVFFLTMPFLNWQDIFNLYSISNTELGMTMAVFFTTLIALFVLGLINSIFNALQLSSYTNLPNILTSSIFTCLIFFLKSQIVNNLFAITCIYGISAVISYLVITFLFFFKSRILSPRLKYFDKRLAKPLISLGSSFFIIQIAVLLIFTVDNFVILQLLGPESVSEYNINFKLFSIFTIGYSILMAPLWSAFTEAYLKGDIAWIKKIIGILKLSIIPLSAIILVFMFFHHDILKLWLPKSESIQTNIKLNFCLFVFVIISVWNNIYSFFLNGVSETALQKRTAIIGALINIPIAYGLIKIFNFGIDGIVVAMCISLLPFAIFGPIEYRKIINKVS